MNQVKIGEEIMDYFFEKGKFTEAELENAFIELFKKQNYEYKCGEEIHRKYTDILIYDDLKEYLKKKNVIYAEIDPCIEFVQRDKDGNIVGEPFMGGIDDQSNYEQLMKQIQSILDQK